MHRLALVPVFLLLTSPAFAALVDQVPLEITLDVAQATTALPGAAGSGTGTGLIDTSTGDFSWNISFSGTTGAETLAHFHIGAPGVPGGVTLGLPVGSPKIGSTVVSLSDAADIAAGLWYVNIHTTHSGGGEIRGQVLAATVPSLSTWGLILAAALLAAGGLYWSRRRAFVRAT